VPLDPGIEGVLALLDTLGRPNLSAGTPEQARRLLRRGTVDVRLLDAFVPVGDVGERTIRVAHGRLRVRIYRPVGARARDRRPTVVFLHGGGFVLGDLDTHDTQCRRLCRDLDAVVVAVDYRLAPDHPFPAGLDDAVAATRWAAEHVDRLGADRDRLVVAGDSAGGNLAAVVAQVWREEPVHGRVPLAAQLLIYPVVDLEDDDGDRYPSRREHADGYVFTGDDLRWFGRHYVGTVEDRSDPRLSPINGDLAGVPPAVIVTAEYDPLRDEGEAYATALAEAGVPVEHRRFDGLIHGFFELASLSPACDEAITATSTLVRRVLEQHAPR
jgi:acetyl esterase